VLPFKIDTRHKKTATGPAGFYFAIHLLSEALAST
jgi:hypothetical protein